jgi:hypothetical protein
MTIAGSRLAGVAIQAVLALLLAYGLVSVPYLVARWGLSPGGLGILMLWCGAASLGLLLARKPPSWALLGSLGLVALVMRVAFAALAIGRQSTGDPKSYLTLAKGLLARHELGIYEPYFGGYWRALFPPLYPFTLAGWGAVAGFSTLSQLAFGTLVDLATAWLLLRLGTRLGKPGAGRVAAWLYLIWPSVLFSAPLAEKEGLCALLVVALALGWTDPARGTWRGAAAIGVPAALLALTQPGEAPLAALFGLVMIGRLGFRTIITIGLRAMAIAVPVMLPWWIRNALVLGSFVPLTSASGASLWIGNNPDATGNWLPPPERLHGLPELVYGKRIGAIAVAWIKAHPVGFIHLTITKFVRACGIGVFGVTRLQAMQPALPAVLTAMLWPLSQGAHLVLLGASALAIRARAAPGAVTLVLLVAACGIQLIGFGVWFEFGERHREFVTPFLLLLICWAIVPGDGDTPVGNAASNP